MAYAVRQRNDSEVVLMRERLLAEEFERDQSTLKHKYRNANAID